MFEIDESLNLNFIDGQHGFVLVMNFLNSLFKKKLKNFMQGKKNISFELDCYYLKSMFIFNFRWKLKQNIFFSSVMYKKKTLSLIIK